jgi:hypothetical protein
MKWFFLVSLIAGSVLCCFVVVMIGLALATHIPGEWWKVLLFLVPFLGLFVWATREMFRSFRKAAQKKVSGRDVA